MATSPQEIKLSIETAERIVRLNSVIAQSARENEILAALCSYAEEYGAASAVLSYLEIDSRGSITDIKDVASWKNKSQPDTEAAAEHLPTSSFWTSTPTQLVFIQDAATDTRLDDETRKALTQANHNAAIILPLYSVGQWQGVIFIYWTEKHLLSAEEEYVFSAVFQPIAAAVANRRAYMSLEHAQYKSEIIAQMNAALGQATSEQEILDAVAVLVERYDAELSTLNYVHYGLEEAPEIIEMVAVQNKGTPIPLSAMGGGTRFPKNAFTLNEIILSSDTPFFMEDVFADPRSEPGSTRPAMKATNVAAFVALPLRSGDRWQGTFTFSWPTPQVFPSELKEILTAITPTAAAVVANRRLLNQAKRQHQISEDRLRTVVNNAPIGLLGLDKTGTFFFSEGKGLRDFGIDPQDLLGTSIYNASETSPELVQQYERALAGESFEALVEVAGRIYQGWYSPVINDHGEIEGAISVSFDITDRRRVELERERLIRQLREASRFKDEFLATMSHELRTPLNAMIGLLGIVLMNNRVEDQDKMFIQRARANSERLLTLINNILDISRMEAGRLEITPSTITLRNVVEKLQQDMGILAEQKRLQLTTEVDDALPEAILIDEDALNKILTNLVANAIKFTEKGSVSLQLLRKDESLIIKVRDTGIGIPIHMQDIIFESFRQADASATRMHGGSGLGLAIVQNLCIAMQGSIRVDSTPGEGSTFTVTLPLHIVDVLEQG